ncbi:monoglyceride lipase isoform X10 [Physeter macrocephalus]|uniref:Monoglyceride lipase isoform X10 n=1 Tax=Physeter macrocephalus TaxID=9755 RepID=A0A455AGT3_PHYMC|nr:monoglyceride lipase isoform X10 [Physeter catodon]|eukprot:XP_028335492.1 monoglyceride lipase isoform X10 [Physeter catodon]
MRVCVVSTCVYLWGGLCACVSLHVSLCGWVCARGVCARGCGVSSRAEAPESRLRSGSDSPRRPPRGAAGGEERVAGPPASHVGPAPPLAFPPPPAAPAESRDKWRRGRRALSPRSRRRAALRPWPATDEDRARGRDSGARGPGPEDPFRMPEESSPRRTPQSVPYQDLPHLVNADGQYLFCRYWKPSGAPRALVFVSHGAGEHCGRYDELARMLVGLELLVFAHDHVNMRVKWMPGECTGPHPRRVRASDAEGSAQPPLGPFQALAAPPPGPSVLTLHIPRPVSLDIRLGPGVVWSLASFLRKAKTSTSLRLPICKLKMMMTMQSVFRKRTSSSISPRLGAHFPSSLKQGAHTPPFYLRQTPRHPRRDRLKDVPVTEHPLYHHLGASLYHVRSLPATDSIFKDI